MSSVQSPLIWVPLRKLNVNKSSISKPLNGEQIISSLIETWQLQSQMPFAKQATSNQRTLGGKGGWQGIAEIFPHSESVPFLKRTERKYVFNIGFNIKRSVCIGRSHQTNGLSTKLAVRKIVSHSRMVQSWGCELIYWQFARRYIFIFVQI